MNILMITMSMNIGGAETHILELCRELKNQGHDITLASFGGVYADEIQSHGIRHVTLPLHNKHPASVRTSYRGLAALIREGHYDLIHSHARIPSFLCGLLQNRLLTEGKKFRLVTTAHLNFVVNPLWRRISCWGDRVMAVSEDIRDYLITEYGYPKERIHTTINGVDGQKFSPDIPYTALLEQWGLDPALRRIVYMSRLDADRADPAYRLLTIAPTLAERFPDTDCLLVGGGTEYDTIAARAEEINRQIGRNFVTVTGAVSNTNEYCAAATVFVGVSRSALEAMSAAKPVIVAGNQGSLGIFDETKTEPAVATNFCCRGFDPATEDTLLADLTHLLSLPEPELSAMGAYNRAFVEKLYTARRMAEDYLTMYRAAISDPVRFRGKEDILISGYYGFGNLGDESLLDGISHTLAEEIPDVKIAALTRHPKTDAPRTGLKCVPRFQFPAVYAAIRRADLLLSGGGSLLQDSTSKRSFTYYAEVMRSAERNGTKVAVYANGIGPIQHPKHRQLTADLVGRADYVSVRDPDSAAELVRLGVSEERIALTADPAFLIPPSSDEAVSRVLSDLGLGGKKFFALSVRPPKKGKSGLFHSHTCAPLTEEDTHLAEEIGLVCADVAKRHDAVPLILMMQESKDAAICTKVRDVIRSHGVESILYTPPAAPELIGILARSRFVIGMRLHAIIFASSAGVPVVALSYDPKVRSMMARLGQEYCVDLTANTAQNGSQRLTEAVCRYVDAIEENHAAICASLTDQAEEMRVLCRKDLAAVRRLLGK